MYSTMTSAQPYSMVPQAMIFRPKDAPDEWKPAVTPTQFRQWVQLERYAGKRDYVTTTTKDLAEVWKNHPRKALEALNALSTAGWVAKDENGLQKGTYRLWIPWFRLNDWDEITEYESHGEFHAGEDVPGSENFLQFMGKVTHLRAKEKPSQTRGHGRSVIRRWPGPAPPLRRTYTFPWKC